MIHNNTSYFNIRKSIINMKNKQMINIQKKKKPFS